MTGKRGDDDIGDDDAMEQADIYVPATKEEEAFSYDYDKIREHLAPEIYVIGLVQLLPLNACLSWWGIWSWGTFSNLLPGVWAWGHARQNLKALTNWSKFAQNNFGPDDIDAWY